MEIRSLTFVATEADLSGTYQQVFGIRFQTLWQVSVSQGKVVARLAELKGGSLSLNFLKAYLLDTIAAAATMLELRDEALLFDVNALLHGRFGLILLQSVVTTAA